MSRIIFNFCVAFAVGMIGYAVAIFQNPACKWPQTAWRNPDRIIAPPMTESGKVTIIGPVLEGYYNFSVPTSIGAGAPGQVMKWDGGAWTWVDDPTSNPCHYADNRSPDRSCLSGVSGKP